VSHGPISKNIAVPQKKKPCADDSAQGSFLLRWPDIKYEVVRYKFVDESKIDSACSLNICWFTLAKITLLISGLQYSSVLDYYAYPASEMK